MYRKMEIEAVNKIDSKENNNKIKETDQLWQMLVKIFPNEKIKDPNEKIKNSWATYNDFIDTTKHPENLERLAAMEKAEREYQRKEWKTIKDDISYNTNSVPQNMRIRTAILAWRILPKITKKEKTYEDIDTFDLSPDKIAYIKATTSAEQYNFYIQNITSGIRDNFNNLSYVQFTAVWDEEMKWVEQRKEYIRSIWWNINQEWIDKLGIINRLIDIGPRIDKYKQKYIENNEDIQKRFDKNVSIKIQSYKEKYPENYKKILEQCNGDEKLANEIIRKEVEIEVFNMFKSEGVITLSQEDEESFAKLNIDFYNKVKELGFKVSDALKNIYNNALNYINNLYQSTDMYVQLSTNVMSDPEFNIHFDKPENKVDKLALENQKNLAYYKNLIKLYPEADLKMEDGTKWSDSFRYFNDDMSLKDPAPENIKNSFEENKSFLVENAKEYETRLLNCTNTIIQKSAIEQCLSALQKTMDIDVDEWKNLLDTFQLDENLDTIVDKWKKLLLNIKGNVNGKKIALSYDLISGEVYYQKYMQKAWFKDTDPIFIWSSELQQTNAIPFMKLPTLGNIIRKGQEMSDSWKYLELMDAAENTLVYEEKLQNILEQSYDISETTEQEIAKDVIKKNIFEDMIVQKMMKIGEREIGEPITNTKQAVAYDLYSYLYRSFEYYGMKSMVYLENWNTCMNTMLLVKEESQKTAPDVLINHEQNNKNQERFVLHSLVNQKVMWLDNTETKNQVVEFNMLAFFQCFEKKIAGMKIIDVDMMNDYFTTVKKNPEEKEVGSWKKKRQF